MEKIYLLKGISSKHDVIKIIPIQVIPAGITLDKWVEIINKYGIILTN